MAGTADDFICLLVHLGLYSDRPVHRGRLRRRARVGTGCGVLRAWLVTTPREAPRQDRPSATTSGTRECASARSKGTAHVQRPKVSPRRVRSQQSPRWSAERRTSRVMGRRAPALAPAGVRHSPADGCRCTRAPVGAPLPSRGVREQLAKLGGLMPREKDDACVDYSRAFLCWVPGQARDTRYHPGRASTPPVSGAATPVVPGNVSGSSRRLRTAR